MAKRLGDPLYSGKTPKKQKIEDHDETLWDDDLDDNCFDEIANQIFEKDDVVQATQQNSSVLVSYESFRPNIPFASTQDIQPSANAFKKPLSVADNEALEMKVTYLQQKCEAKEGEVSILRAQMKKIKADMMNDLSKKQKEYHEITNLKEKEIKTIKGQLDFKDLEIANLKQKIMEMSRTNMNNSGLMEMNKKSKVESPFRNTLPTRTRESNSNMTKEIEKDFKTSILIEPEYIKPSKDFSKFFDSSIHEIHVVETRDSQFGRNTNPYLHNQMIQEELTIPPGPKVTANINNKEVALEHIYAEIFDVFQCNVSENSLGNKNIIINKLLGVSFELLKNFLTYLDQLENIYRTEDIEQLDRIFIQKNSKEHHIEDKQKSGSNCEIGIRAGRTIKVVAELLPYNEYLKNLLITNQKNYEISPDLGVSRNLRQKNSYFLIINDILRKIFCLRKTDVCQTFINSVAILILVLSKEDLYIDIFPVFTSLVGSLLFTRPSSDILYNILLVFKYCSKSKNFLDFLCAKPDGKKFTVDKKRKLNYFSEDTCKFTLFVSLLNHVLKGTKETELSLDITSNVLSFVDNVFTSNPSWVYDQQNDRCTCLEKLFQLIIEVLYQTLSEYKKNKHRAHKTRYISIFKCGIRIFELLFFNSYDFIEKFIDSYSRYKEICKSFLEYTDDLDLIEETNNLEKLCLFEDVPNVSSSSFELI